MRDGRGGTRPRLASSGGLPGPTHRTAPVSCSPPGNKGASLTRSGCCVGPAGTVTAVAAQHPSPAPGCPLGAHLLLFSPMGSDCDCPLPGPGRGCGMPSWPRGPASQGRAGPGPSPGAPRVGSSRTCDSTARSPEPELEGRPGGSEGRAPSASRSGSAPADTGHLLCHLHSEGPSPGTSLLPRSQGSCLTAPRQPSC